MFPSAVLRVFGPRQDPKPCNSESKTELAHNKKNKKTKMNDLLLFALDQERSIRIVLDIRIKLCDELQP